MFYVIEVSRYNTDDAGVSHDSIYLIDNLADAWAIERRNNYEYDDDECCYYESSHTYGIDVVHEPFVCNDDRFTYHSTINGGYYWAYSAYKHRG